MKKYFTIFIFIIAILLRIALSCVNFEANDNHIEVVRIIKDQERLPVQEDCRQCYHPKLYHITLAYLSKIFSIDTDGGLVRLGQYLNCIAGIITIFIFWFFLINIPLNHLIRLICFSIVALNPKLIGINSQATNDSFVILFSSLAFYGGFHFFNTNGFKYFLVMTISSALAILSKGSGLVLFFGILLVFGFKLLKEHNYKFNLKSSYLRYLLIFSLFIVATVLAPGQYLRRFHQRGFNFISHKEFAPFPHFYKISHYKRPGITSIASSYFTFRIVDMLKNPTITNDASVYPLHRTSFWSQLYGRTHFVYFDMWPPAWQTTDRLILNIGRIILILALVPSFLLLYAVVKNIRLWVEAILKRDFSFIVDTNDWIFDIFTFAYIGALALYTLGYRDFSSIKAIYLFPATLPIIGLLSQGIKCVYNSLETRKMLMYLFNIVLIILLTLYCLTTIILIYNLAS